MYEVVIEVALAYRIQYGLERLHAVEQRAREKRGDILEWVMGTRKKAGADSAWLA